MPSIRQLEEQGRALLEDQKALVDDPQPWSAKRVEFDNRDKDIKAVLSQHAALKAVDRRAFGVLAGDDPSDRSRPLRGLHAGIAAAGYQPIPAPQMDLAEKDIRELYDAAVSHKSLSVSTKAATDSTTITPAALPDFRLPPVTALREPTRVLSLLPTYATNNSSVEWFSTAGTTAAAPVAEGAAKPTSTIAYPAQTTSATKLAHVAEVNRRDTAGLPGVPGGARGRHDRRAHQGREAGAAQRDGCRGEQVAGSAGRVRDLDAAQGSRVRPRLHQHGVRRAAGRVGVRGAGRRGDPPDDVGDHPPAQGHQRPVLPHPGPDRGHDRGSYGACRWC